MHKSSKLFAKEYGLISMYLFVPIFMALFLSAAICFSIACKQAEFNIVRTKNLSLENIFMQSEAIIYKWFENEINNRNFTPDFSSVATDNAIINPPSNINNEIAAIDDRYLINSYIIDENYPITFYLKAGKLAVNQNVPIYKYDDSGNGYANKRYAIICEIKHKLDRGNGKYICYSEVIVSLYKGSHTVNRLHERRYYVLE